MSEHTVVLEDKHTPHLAVIFRIANQIAWAGERDTNGRLGLAHQVNVDHDMLTDLRCALTDIGIGRPE